MQEEAKHRRGDTREDGKVYWTRSERDGERWLSQEQYAKAVLRHAARASKDYHTKTQVKERCKSYAEVYRKTPVNRERLKKYFCSRYIRDRVKLIEQQGKYIKKRYANDPKFAILVRLRSRLRSALRWRVRSGVSSRTQDRVSVEFLVWCMNRYGIRQADLKYWHIDHLVPLRSMTELGSANDPENVRWLRGSDNLAKRGSMPPQEEIDAHLALVAEWRASLVK